MKILSHFLLVCVFVAATVLNGTNAAADDLQKAERAYDKGNSAAAIKLLLPLAKGGNAKAQHLLGLTYDFADGRTGVKSDNTKAQFWYEKAVKQDYLPAIRDLGAHLLRELKNVKRGYRLLKTAAERGDAKAQFADSRVSRQLSLGLSRVSPFDESESCDFLRLVLADV